jgi:hypothetical protein
MNEEGIMGDVTQDFYEDDEPLEDVVAAFNAGPHGLTARPLPAGATVVRAVTSFVAGQTVSPRPGAFQIARPGVRTA